MPLSTEQIVRYYSRSDIQKEMIKTAKGREVAGRTWDDSFMKRPGMLQYPQDVTDRVKAGYASFHCSVERWSNPMALGPELRNSDLDELRTGWDLIIDLDASVKLEHARIVAVCIVDFFKEYGITPTVKFSGRRGFHIAVAKNAFPQEVNFSFLSKRYPDITRTIIRFIKEKIKERVLDELIKLEGGVAELMKLTNEKDVDPYKFVDVEENWGNRHLFRMPYSLHMKTGLASVPIMLFKLKNFEPEQAALDKVKILPYLENKDGEATELLLQALDWDSKTSKKEVEVKTFKRKKNTTPIPEEFFPPCMKTLLAGIENGKKRSIFSLITFLKSVNWEQEKIEETVNRWNDNNGEKGNALSSQYVKSQIRWHERQHREILPANCESDMFWHSTTPKLCEPDGMCKMVKNPVNYAFKRFFAAQRNKSVGAGSNKGKMKPKKVMKTA
jgi:DNA primase catalytic subunit